MAVAGSEETALSSARGRFLESLPRKAIELRGTLAMLTAVPGAEGPRAELRRKLHALYASAQVFDSEALAALAKEAIGCLDAASEAGRALGPSDLDMLARAVKRLAELRDAQRFSAPPPAPSSMVQALGQHAVAEARSAREAPDTARPNFTKTTLTGMPPVGTPVATPSEMPGRLVKPASRRPEITIEQHRPRRRGAVFQRIVHVLLLVDAAELSAFASLLTDEDLRVSVVHQPAAALAMVQDDPPDVLLADAELARSATLVATLRAEPSSEFLPVVLVTTERPGFGRADMRAEGVDALITRPLRSEHTKEVLGRVTGTLVEVGALAATPEAATLEEICARVQEELRKGLLDAADVGRDLKIPLGDGAEILAAAFSAIARVRAVVTERSGGRVHFEERASLGAPLLLATNAEPLANPSESPLAGRRVLVADDDTAVLLFFAGLLREEGASVSEASDGHAALRAARRERPDLIISDGVMPGLDGFALCRALKRDPLLADVPVVLMSWKEDLLVRMRELSSGAAGYLRKEASSAQILSGVRAALFPRAELETRLQEAGEVRGSLEGVGVVALLRSVRKARPNARITLRDAWNMFECELRAGRLAQLTRTASDGSFVRNEAALPPLLGISRGRFTVSDAPTGLKHAFSGTLDEVLARGARDLAALLHALSGTALGEVERVVFDEDAELALRDHAAPALRVALGRLARGTAPRALWQDGTLERPLLEAMLVDLAKRGAVRAVVGSDGDDCVARAYAELPVAEPLDPVSELPPAPAPRISVLSVKTDDPHHGLHGPTPHGDYTPVGALLPPAIIPSEPAVAAHEALEGAPLERVGGDEENAANAGERSEPEVAPAHTGMVREPELSLAEDEPTPRLASLPVPASEVRELEPNAGDARGAPSALWGWSALFLVLLGLGFVVDRARHHASRAARIEAIEALPEVSKPEVQSLSALDAALGVAEARVETAEPKAASEAPELVREGGFQIYDHLLDSNVSVKPDEALLVVDALPSGTDAQLSIDGVPLGALPAKTALSEGIHELAITRGDTVMYRFLSPKRGATWVLQSP